MLAGAGDLLDVEEGSDVKGHRFHVTYQIARTTEIDYTRLQADILVRFNEWRLGITTDDEANARSGWMGQLLSV
jgi:hypothetical protein